MAAIREAARVMRKPLVAGNWKMHGSREFVAAHLDALGDQLSGLAIDVAVFPPAVYLDAAARRLQGLPVTLGAQDLSLEEGSGAFTGEVSGAMLSDIGCSLVLVGHSERRTRYGESDAVVARKFVAACAAGLVPVLCVGETLEQREAGETRRVVADQLEAVATMAGRARVAASIIAYEPVWAIGTGRTATPDQAQDVHQGIRHWLGAEGAETRILYGGSVKAANARELFSRPDIDGGLIGGAALVPEEFSAICRQADQR